MRAKVPHPLWASHLRSFSDMHRGWLVRLDGVDGGEGELPLAGIDVTQRGIVVRLGRGEGSFTHIVSEPIGIDETRRTDGALEALTLRGRESVCRIVFRTIVAPELVDGVVDAGVPPRVVRIAGAGLVLEAELSVPQRALGVVCVAARGPCERTVARTLHATGIGTLLLTSYAGPTAETRLALGLIADRLIAASDWLGRLGATRRLPLGYFGSGAAGAAALVAATWRPGIRAIMARSTRPDLAAESLPRVRCPVSLVAPGSDQAAIALSRQALTCVRSEKELVVTPENDALDEVGQAATRWFARWLGASATQAAPA